MTWSGSWQLPSWIARNESPAFESRRVRIQPSMVIFVPTGTAPARTCAMRVLVMTPAFLPQRVASMLPTTVRFMPIWTDTALPSIATTVLPFMYQPKLPVENCLTSASISWPLITTLSGSAFSMNCVRDTGQEVFGGMGRMLHSEPCGVCSCSCLSSAAVPITGGDGGDGDGNGSNGDAQSCDSRAVTLRDFTSSHPDFEKSINDDRGAVQAMLGSDQKPVYATAGRSAGGTISGPASSDLW